MHGFTQTARSWDPLLEPLAAVTGRDVVAIDAPGHGTHPDTGRLDLWAGADAIGGEGGRAAYCGYSMGGRLALHLALAAPALVEALVLVGATPGLRTERERADRRHADARLAEELERDGLDAFLDRWLANPLFAGLSPDAAGRALRRANTLAGLAASLRHAGTGSQDDLWPRLGELQMPVLCVAGEDDGKFSAIAGDMATAIGANARVAIIPGSGHTVHLEQPDAFVAAVATFLAGS